MATMLIVSGARLPTIGGDSGNWGSVLNAFLQKEHKDDGTHGNVTAESLNVSGYVNITGNVEINGSLLARDIGGIINVKAFGAKGDNVTDDTAAIKAAFSAVPSIGGEVFFPAGTYIINPSNANRMRVMKSGTTVRGVPGKSIIKMADGGMETGNGGIMLSNADHTNGNKDIAILGMTFDGNLRGNPGGPFNSSFSPPALQFVRVNGLRIENSEVFDTAHAGIVTVISNDILITNNRIYNIGQSFNADAIQVNGAIGTIISNNIVENVGEGIFCQHYASTPQTITRECNIVGNVIISYEANGRCTGNGIPFACCTGQASGSGTGFCAAGIPQGPAIDVLAQGATVESNIIRGHWFIAAQAFVGHGNFTTSDIIISGNLLIDVNSGSGNGAILLSTDGPTISRIRISENHVRNTEDSGVKLRSNTGSAIIQDIIIEGNTLDTTCTVQTSCAGIFLDSSVGDSPFTNIFIQANRIVNGYKYGIWLEPTTTNVRVIQNIIENNTLGPFNFATDSKFDEYTLNTGVTKIKLDNLNSTGVGKGSFIYCTDCVPNATCSSGGDGAFAKRQGSPAEWVCN